jgi:thioredoxin-dependent peroxiredoxin
MPLKINDIAPPFTGTDQDNKTVKLADFIGKKLVLYFYPKDNTPGCTAQACNLRDNYEALLQAGYEVVGISTDSAASHQRFIANKQLPFRLIADETHAIHEQYGAWVEKSMYGKKYWGTSRLTFVIDETGKIAKIIDRVTTANHAAQILGTPDTK